MAAAIVAAVAALAGVLLQSLIGDWRARTERRRSELAHAAEQFLGALAEHRQHQYLKIEARRRGEPDTQDARRDRYTARTQVTKARAALLRSTQNQELLELARIAVDTSFAVGDAADDEVQTVGDRARAAHNTFQEAAARLVFNHR